MDSVAKPGVRSASAMDPSVNCWKGELTVPARNAAAISGAGLPRRQGDISGGEKFSGFCHFQTCRRGAYAAHPCREPARVLRKVSANSRPSMKSQTTDVRIRFSDIDSSQLSIQRLQPDCQLHLYAP